MSDSKRLFVLKYTFKNVLKLERELSPIETHFGLPWRILVKRSSSHFGIYLSIKENIKSNLWKIYVKYVVKISQVDGTERKKASKKTFSQKSTTWGCPSFVLWNDFVEKYAKDNEITVEIDVNIKKMTGILQKRSIDFQVPDGMLTDVCLVVSNKKFYVSKTMLASFSPVFKAMFFGEFVEAKSAEVKIEDVEATSFEVFLSVIYSCDREITAETVENLLKLADRYDVEHVKNKCVDFLLTNDDLKIEKKLELAEQFTLALVQEYCVESLKSLKDVKLLRQNMIDMQPATSLALLDKAVSFA